VGIEIERDSYDEADYVAFGEKLRRCLDALRALLERPTFGAGDASVGCELELDLVDDEGRPMPINRAVLASTLDGRVTLEIDRFNLEINGRPCPLAGRPFTTMKGELDSALAAVRKAARGHGAKLVTVGILPTLRASDLERSALTDARRYRALSAGLRRVRGRPFAVSIEGDEALSVEAHDVTLEGANTSFQVHLRVGPADYARTYNAAQIATAFVLAVSCNSPFFLGRRLWRETRVALFRQSVDERVIRGDDDWRPARVSFGHGWVRSSALELFAESVALHEPLLPQVGREDPEAALREGAVPSLAELRLHHGTVWRWNRAVYDDAAGGHLRIEMRALPAGPTVRDMAANAAVAIGLTRALANDADTLVTRLTFGQARRNFYHAARFGLDAELLWPTARGPSPRPAPVGELAPRLLTLAREGLEDAGVDAHEADTWTGIVRERVARRASGALWQVRAVAGLEPRLGRDRALAAMLSRYRELGESGDPIHAWPA
jgi:hypothetical protein